SRRSSAPPSISRSVGPEDLVARIGRFSPVAARFRLCRWHRGSDSLSKPHMVLHMRQELRMSQQLVMTPQLQQAIKLLQLSRIELQDLVRNELLENPLLEEAQEIGTSSEDPVSSVEMQDGVDQQGQLAEPAPPEVPSQEVRADEPNADNFD